MPAVAVMLCEFSPDRESLNEVTQWPALVAVRVLACRQPVGELNLRTTKSSGSHWRPRRRRRVERDREVRERDAAVRERPEPVHGARRVEPDVATLGWSPATVVAVSVPAAETLVNATVAGA
jgi:hypothetical protein